MSKQSEANAPHPRKEPRIPGPLSLERLKEVFADCADFSKREVYLHGDSHRKATVCYIDGQARSERLNDYVLRPLAQDPMLATAPESELFDLMERGALYAHGCKRETEPDPVVMALINGSCALFLEGRDDCLVFPVATEEKRSVGEPENEPALKGARDSFVENLRTNTSLTRRHLKCPELRIKEQIVGRQSLTPVDVLWLEGIADPDTVGLVEEQIQSIDIDALLATGNLEEYLTDTASTPFPMVLYTERPDRFCYGLSQGKVGILVEGFPLGYLVPGVIRDFLMAPQDRSENWLLASALTVLRWGCLLVTLYLPGLYVAMVNFHPEMIPARLALSIMAARRDVPFSALFEALLLLVAFEVLQEAGLRLPPSIGQTVSILGGLVVGSAAVEARLISPAVLVVVAVAGIAGYTMPSQDLAGALRLWRFGMAVLGGLAGLFGVAVGTALLAGHLAGLESFGVAYLTPFAGPWAGREKLLRQPLPGDKLRPAHLRTRNRRKQK